MIESDDVVDDDDRCSGGSGVSWPGNTPVSVTSLNMICYYYLASWQQLVIMVLPWSVDDRVWEMESQAQMSVVDEDETVLEQPSTAVPARKLCAGSWRSLVLHALYIINQWLFSAGWVDMWKIDLRNASKWLPLWTYRSVKCIWPRWVDKRSDRHQANVKFTLSSYDDNIISYRLSPEYFKAP